MNLFHILIYKKHFYKHFCDTVGDSDSTKFAFLFFEVLPPYVPWAEGDSGRARLIPQPAGRLVKHMYGGMINNSSYWKRKFPYNTLKESLLKHKWSHKSLDCQISADENVSGSKE